jgi:hypothetical protein
MKNADSPKLGDCGDYSTTVITGNNLSLVELKMRPADGA